LMVVLPFEFTFVSLVLTIPPVLIEK